MPADAPTAFTCARVAVEVAPGEYALRAERATLELQPLSLSVKAAAACRQRGASVTNAAWLRAPPTPHGADVEAIVDRLCVQPHLAEAVLSKLVGVLQPQR